MVKKLKGIYFKFDIFRGINKLLTQKTIKINTGQFINLHFFYFHLFRDIFRIK